jgi:RNA polymerase sigma factor (sigma-70 family)
MQTDQMSQDVLCDDLAPSDGVEPEGQAVQNRARAIGTATIASELPLATVVRAAAAGDQLAWQELVNRFDGMIGSVGRRYGLGAADVDELRQITWLQLVVHIGRLEQPERIGGWLSTTARRESGHILSRAARYTSGTNLMLAHLPDVKSPEVDARSLSDETNASLMRAWARLKPRCQELLSHVVADDAVGYQELSKLLNMPVGSIGPTRGRCVEHLRRLAAEEGLTAR